MGQNMEKKVRIEATYELEVFSSLTEEEIEARIYEALDLGPNMEADLVHFIIEVGEE